jgi:hypothetical protein
MSVAVRHRQMGMVSHEIPNLYRFGDNQIRSATCSRRRSAFLAMISCANLRFDANSAALGPPFSIASGEHYCG